MYVYIDIETIPSQRNEARERAAAKVHPPGNMSKAETIAKWEAEKRPALEDAEWRKTSFDGGWGELACICWAVLDGPVQEAKRPALADSEADCLRSFFDRVHATQKEYNNRPISWVGHNLTGFDLRFLYQRAVVLGVAPPFNLRQDDPPWRGAVIDTMHLWGIRRDYNGKPIKTGLVELCDILRVDVGHEDTIDGSMVWDEYRAGRFDVVLQHCRADVERTRAVHKRIAFL